MANDTRERILDAALEMFSQNGYAGTNIRELSASLGLVKSGIYKHFESLLWGTIRFSRAPSSRAGLTGGAGGHDNADGGTHGPR